MRKSILLLIFLVGFVLIGCTTVEDAKLTVNKTDHTLQVSDSVKIQPKLENVKKGTVVKFSSSDEDVVEVDDNGNVTALSAGSATITVTVEGYDKLKVTVTITVEEEIDLTDQITVEGPKTVVAGEVIQLTAVDKLDTGHGVLWEALTPQYARVSNTGEVTGVSEGTAKFQVFSMENGNSIEIEIEVTMAIVKSLTVKSNINDTRIKTTDNLRLSATVEPKAADQTVVWESDDDSIAAIDENGRVNILTFGEVTFTAKSAQDNKILDTITFEFYWDVMDLIDYIVVADPVVKLNAKGYGYEAGYEAFDVQILGSVSNFYFGAYKEFERIAPLTNDNRPGIKATSIEYVTIHDTASGAPSATAQAHANYVFNGGGGTSWHYSIGNDGVWFQIPLDEISYHAGDGSRIYQLNDTGVKVKSKVKPKVEISKDGYYTLNGEKTTILAPKGSNGETLTTNYINDFGITLEIGDNGNWHMGNTYYNSTYKLIANGGGNRNSIGIETMINQGSDFYLTWHYTAKKSAELLLQHDLGLDRLTFHHFFSGKDCPNTMRNNGLVDNFLKMVEAEYLIKKFLGDYTISFISNNQDIVDNTGRIISVPNQDTQVSYLITVENNEGFSQSKIYYSTVPGK